MVDQPDIRIYNRNGMVTAMVITTHPELYRQYNPSNVATDDDVHHIMRYEGSNVFDLVMNCVNNIEYSHEMNLVTQSSFVPFHYTLIHPLAIPPHRARQSNSGYDLTLISKGKHIGDVILYGTGVSVVPPGGFYFDMVPTNRLIETGHILANSVGIIDQNYTGEIMVPLIKVNKNAPDIELPCKIVQLIPRRWYGLTPVEDTNITTNNISAP